VKLIGVEEIFDNGMFVTLVTNTGSAIHLPEGKHSISVLTEEALDGKYSPYIVVELYEA